MQLVISLLVSPLFLDPYFTNIYELPQCDKKMGLSLCDNFIVRHHFFLKKNRAFSKKEKNPASFEARFWARWTHTLSKTVMKDSSDEAVIGEKWSSASCGLSSNLEIWLRLTVPDTSSSRRRYHCPLLPTIVSTAARNCRIFWTLDEITAANELWKFE